MNSKRLVIGLIVVVLFSLLLQAVSAANSWDSQKDQAQKCVDEHSKIADGYKQDREKLNEEKERRQQEIDECKEKHDDALDKIADHEKHYQDVKSAEREEEKRAEEEEKAYDIFSAALDFLIEATKTAEEKLNLKNQAEGEMVAKLSQLNAAISHYNSFNCDYEDTACNNNKENAKQRVETLRGEHEAAEEKFRAAEEEWKQAEEVKEMAEEREDKARKDWTKAWDDWGEIVDELQELDAKQKEEFDKAVKAAEESDEKCFIKDPYDKSASRDLRTKGCSGKSCVKTDEGEIGKIVNDAESQKTEYPQKNEKVSYTKPEAENAGGFVLGDKEHENIDGMITHANTWEKAHRDMAALCQERIGHIIKCQQGKVEECSLPADFEARQGEIMRTAKELQGDIQGSEYEDTFKNGMNTDSIAKQYSGEASGHHDAPWHGMEEGETKEIENPDGGKTTYENIGDDEYIKNVYDKDGNLVSSSHITDNENDGTITERRFDNENGRETVETTKYNEKGEPVSLTETITDKDGTRTEREYDYEKGTFSQEVKDSDGKRISSVSLDENGMITETRIDEKTGGEIKTVTNENGDVHTEYPDGSRKVVTDDGAIYEIDKNGEKTYTPPPPPTEAQELKAGESYEQTDISGVKTKYTKNEDGTITRETTFPDESTETSTITDHGNGKTTEVFRDENGEVTKTLKTSYDPKTGYTTESDVKASDVPAEAKKLKAGESYKTTDPDTGVTTTYTKNKDGTFNKKTTTREDAREEAEKNVERNIGADRTDTKGKTIQAMPVSDKGAGDPQGGDPGNTDPSAKGPGLSKLFQQESRGGEQPSPTEGTNSDGSGPRPKNVAERVQDRAETGAKRNSDLADRTKSEGVTKRLENYPKSTDTPGTKPGADAPFKQVPKEANDLKPGQSYSETDKVSGQTTTYTRNDDGSLSKTVTDKGGNVVETSKSNGDGTVSKTIQNNDGSTTTTTYNDKGEVVSATTKRVNEDGSVTTSTQGKDGSKTITTTGKDGTRTTVTEGKDGTRTTTVVKPDGTSETSITTRDKNGVETTKHADGSTTVRKPDGTVVTKNADGTTVTKKGDTTVIQNSDGTTTTTVKNSDGTTTKTVTSADGHTTVTKYDKGGQALKGPDGDKAGGSSSDSYNKGGTTKKVEKIGNDINSVNTQIDNTDSAADKAALQDKKNDLVKQIAVEKGIIDSEGTVIKKPVVVQDTSTNDDPDDEWFLDKINKETAEPIVDVGDIPDIPDAALDAVLSAFQFVASSVTKEVSSKEQGAVQSVYNGVLGVEDEEEAFISSYDHSQGDTQTTKTTDKEYKPAVSVDTSKLVVVYVNNQQVKTEDGTVLMVHTGDKAVYKVSQDGIELVNTKKMTIREMIDPLTGDIEYVAHFEKEDKLSKEVTPVGETSKLVEMEITIEDLTSPDKNAPSKEVQKVTKEINTVRNEMNILYQKLDLLAKISDGEEITSDDKDLMRALLECTQEADPQELCPVKTLGIEKNLFEKILGTTSEDEVISIVEENEVNINEVKEEAISDLAEVEIKHEELNQELEELEPDPELANMKVEIKYLDEAKNILYIGPKIIDDIVGEFSTFLVNLNDEIIKTYKTKYLQDFLTDGQIEAFNTAFSEVTQSFVNLDHKDIAGLCSDIVNKDNTTIYGVLIERENLNTLKGKCTAIKQQLTVNYMLVDISCIGAIVDADNLPVLENIEDFLQEKQCLGANIGRCIDISTYMLVIGKDEMLWEVQCVLK